MANILLLCRPLIIFAIALGSDWIGQLNLWGPVLDPDLNWVFLKECFKKVDFEKNLQMTKTHKNYPVGRVNSNLVRPKKKDPDLWRNMTIENFSKLWQSGIWDKKCKTRNDKEMKTTFLI